MESRIKKVIVVGAGPAGLLTAHMLGQKGIAVDVVEAGATVNEAPRGLAYGPSANRTLRNAGIYKTMIDAGFIPRSFVWRKASGEYMAGMEWGGPVDLDRDQYIVCPVGTMSKILQGLVEKQPLASIHWQRKTQGVGQDEDHAWIEFEDASRSTGRMTADFVVGCDGGASNVRKSLFGKSFPGFTWPYQFIAVNVRYDLEKHGWSDANWIVDPEHWFHTSKITSDGLWRIAYGEEHGQPLDQLSLEARVKQKLQIILPGNPSPDQFHLEAVTPYGIHQRLAERMRVGRVLLAGDAAHLNNPMGGLGLTTGVSDVGALVDCLVGIHEGKASMEILDKYDETRRRIFSTIVDPTTTANLKRIIQKPEDATANDPFFEMIQRAAEDPKAAEELMKFELSIDHDMTEFYDKSSTTSEPNTDIDEHKPSDMDEQAQHLETTKDTPV